MTVVGCEYRLSPGNAEHNVGDTVTCSLEAYNCGTENGNIYVIIDDSDGGHCEYNAWLDPYVGIASCQYDFVMPGHDVIVDYFIGHWTGSTWMQDWQYSGTVTVPIPATCTERFTVIDELTGSLIDPDSITVNGVSATRISLGVYDIVLVQDTQYEVITSKSGYYTDHAYFVACYGKTVDLEPIVQQCGQYINVSVSAGEETDFTLEWGDGTWEVGTTPKRCYYDYEQGISVTATASATDYQSASRTFTTCVPEFTLALVPTFGYLYATSNPSDAQVWIDYGNVGTFTYSGYQTPITLRVPVGTHRVQVRKTGYRNSEPQTITIAGGETTNLNFVLAFAGVYIQSCSPVQFPLGWYGIGSEMRVNIVIANDTAETVEAKVKLTAEQGTEIVDAEPDMYWKNIGPSETWAISVGVPSEENPIAYFGNEKLRAELWLQGEAAFTDSVDITIGKTNGQTDWKMLAIYGGATVGVYAAGEITGMKAIKLAALIPLGLAGYEGYKMLKEEGWL